ncbi:MAG: Stk1 family PASTA domain-containing Ser/Thr kinase [Propionibacteriaceae bacterium]|jgi:serine/threonine-protein kinase|nr:Stk1 family PASTA domain-containing Ser/Thr kinase [Propionibacteriaceae bacterium]
MTETLLGDRYILGPLLGRGGMAEVRRARDIRLERDVAIKQLRPDLAGDTVFQARFRREAQAAAGLNHPNIVAVYDTGEQFDANSGVDVPYIVMELVIGHTLRDILRDGRKIQPERALELIQSVLSALEYSHRHGIVHRDIKPANVMVTAAGVVKVMDFGIARAVSDTSASMTQTAAVIGTPQYLSPEQIRGDVIDRRSDIYATGCLLYELLAGRPPFQGDSPVSLAYQHVREMPLPPSRIDPVISSSMDAICLKALAKDPAQRYQTAKDMSDDIDRLLSGKAVDAVPLAPVPDLAADAPTQVMTAATPPATPLGPARALPAESDEAPAAETRGSRKGLIILIIGLVVVLVGLLAGGLWWINHRKPVIETVSVPRLIDLDETAAVDSLQSYELVPQIEEVNLNDNATINRVTRQQPIAGTPVDKGSTVIITINRGPLKGVIPSNLRGLDKGDAERILRAAGFTNVVPTPATSERATDLPNTVISVNPSEGAEVELSRVIELVYATGKSEVRNVFGQTRDTAVSLLTKDGFVPEVIEQPDTQAAQTVIRTDPPAGTLLDRGSTVKVYVAVPIVPPTTSPPPTTPSGPSTSTTPI